MLSTKLATFLWSPYLLYVLAFSILIAILIWVWIELIEYSIRKKCISQNIPYVKIPSSNLTLMLGQRFDLIESELAKKHGKVFGGNMFNQPIIYVSDPELVQIICNREFTKFANRRSFITYDPIWDNFLFTVADEKWKRLRAIVSPTFSSGKLRKIKYCIDENVDKMFEHLDRKIANNDQCDAINMKKLIGAFTMDTIIQISMGMKINSLDDPDSLVLKYARRLFCRDVPWRDTILFALSFKWPELLKYFNLRIQPESMDYFRKCSLEVIRQNRAKLMNADPSFRATNFIELILEVENEQRLAEQQNVDSKKPFKHITNDELIAQCITFFTVGYDTTATTITNTCYTMATHPDKQEKLHQSIIETLDQLAEERTDGCVDPYQLITFDTINRFEYLNACLNETMRYLTLATASERVATEDVRLETSDKKIWFDVRKGDIIRMPINYIHHCEENYANAEQFIPERFLPNNQYGHFNKYAFLPFGSGPRKCVGANLALLEAKIALVHIFRMYRLSVHPKATKIPLEFYINSGILISKDVSLMVEKRK